MWLPPWPACATSWMTATWARPRRSHRRRRHRPPHPAHPPERRQPGGAGHGVRQRCIWTADRHDFSGLPRASPATRTSTKSPLKGCGAPVPEGVAAPKPPGTPPKACLLVVVKARTANLAGQRFEQPRRRDLGLQAGRTARSEVLRSANLATSTGCAGRRRSATVVAARGEGVCVHRRRRRHGAGAGWTSKSTPDPQRRGLDPTSR
jgi:hypothetical protein